jgi:RimJ/RimL family protein N-acetyltransferase
VLTWQPEAQFDAVLLDAPCSATGTFRRHPDVLHRIGPKQVAELVELQAAMLDKAAAMVKPGGRLVYATCSLEPEEGEAQADAFLARHGNFRQGGYRHRACFLKASRPRTATIRTLPGMLADRGRARRLLHCLLHPRAIGSPYASADAHHRPPDPCAIEPRPLGGLCRGLGRSAMTAFIGGQPRTRTESWGKFLAAAALWQFMGYGYWSFLDRATGKFLGNGGLAWFERGIAELEGVPEAGWAFIPEAWGKGLATEAMAAVLNGPTGV